jgi:hypothetical protein
MRQPRSASAIPFALALAIAGALAAALPAQAQEPSPVVLGPYKRVAITLPPVVNDPGFEAFRKQLAAVTQKKDRAALAKLVAASFFWIPEDMDAVDKSKSAIANLAIAIGLDRQGAPGWDTLASFALERTGRPDPQRPGVICAPAEPGFDDNAANDLANATHTEAADWGYPVRDGVEVRASRETNAAVVDKLGLHLVRILPDDSPANAVMLTTLKVLSPAGKTGFVPFDSILSLLTEQMCYLKDASGWKIAGFVGGDASQ